MMGWISVKDRLPPDCESVMIWSKGMTPITAWLAYDKGEVPRYYQINDWDESDQILSLKDITHWMPLPEPPKE